ncbi:serine threonine protein kinase [Botryosphaeria dothidea]|uniref:Serine threonine protein kinase n=1 Tax=Botryosphaeria dothidea TaxID=55169 RepID=A0A8H4N3K9_9PEZI|nr:serine threonine protein kinase [Botryosphaeria dothidea]
MKEFRRLNFNDDVLPIKETPCAKSGIFDDCSHSQALAVFHDRDLWSYDTIQKFCEEQWTFLAPVFTESAAKQELPLNSILPYTWMDTVSKHSHFSRVTKAKIRTDHLAVVETVRTPLMQGFQHPENNFRQSETELEVAVKELIKSPNTKDPDLKKAWDVEAEALLAISNLKNNHLIRRIAAFSRQSRYFLIFEWANGGSLHEFWKNNPKPTLSHQLVQDVVIQLLGLSRALRALHNNDKSESNIGTGNWRHGDLKPDNILRFRGPNTPEDSLGTLKIADLGLAKLHDVDTNLRADPTSQKCGTLKYEPPEALHPHRSPRSRRYDICSMGCIILESIIWLLYGYEGLEVFNGEAVDDPNRETVFYKVDNQGQVPSWSWMAYEGGIDYLNPPFNGTDWERGIKSPWTQQSSQESSWHTTDRRGNRVLEGKAYKFSVGNDDDITFDHEDNKEVENLGCVVIGTSKLGIDQKNKEYYVLVIGKQSGSGWERIGAGKLLGKSIAFDGATDVEIH